MADNKSLSELVLRDSVAHFSPQKGSLLFINCGETCLYDWNFDEIKEEKKGGKEVHSCVLEGLTVASIDGVNHPASAELKEYFLRFDAIIYCLFAEEIVNQSTQQLTTRFLEVADEYSVLSILIYDPADLLAGVDLVTRLNFYHAPNTWCFRKLDDWNQLYILRPFNDVLDILMIQFRNQIRYQWKQERARYRRDWYSVESAAKRLDNMDGDLDGDLDGDVDDGRYNIILDNAWRSDFDLSCPPTPSPPSDYD